MRKESNADKLKANTNSPNRGSLDGSPGQGSTDRNAVMQVRTAYPACLRCHLPPDAKAPLGS
jgi:hypothetical protein